MTDEKLKLINQTEWKAIVKCTKEVADEICGKMEERLEAIANAQKSKRTFQQPV